MASLTDKVVLDVSELAAPEPMRAILLQLLNLADEQYLQVVHRKEPIPLYQKLTEMGFVYHTELDKPITSFCTISICREPQASQLQQLLGVHPK